ncbi:carboxypeptidase-like regulatory domain-containing protein [Aestuariivivens sediminicola]|uniref:carboxypeptidase-like regulatory domain-containing protein n=1 Tax=Aestuariivivens sediminicola TaxID=2913560 RepID=UPI001F57F3EB|nr:carboxypeptidase-like regulatory domain-containing protein [Aestuariivivens sediminicola]
MKKIVFLLLSLSLVGYAQEYDRIIVNGKLIVEGNDLSDITVYNVSSKLGTITDEKGRFEIAVGLGDTIQVSALQYQNISFTVNNDIVQSKSMKLFLIEEINKLDEVIIFPKGHLTGNLETDISDRNKFRPKLDVLYFGIKNSDKFQFDRDYLNKIDNIALSQQDLPMVNGLNIINVVDQLLLPLFRSNVKNKKQAGVPEVPIEKVKYYFGSEFLVDNFGIPEHRVTEFIAYVESKDFDFSLLNYGRELEFLELLYKKSVTFLNK